jgi:hypothetical protein
MVSNSFEKGSEKEGEGGFYADHNSDAVADNPLQACEGSNISSGLDIICPSSSSINSSNMAKYSCNRLAMEPQSPLSSEPHSILETANSEFLTNSMTHGYLKMKEKIR